VELPPARSGHRYCVTILCTFTKFLIAVPTRRCRAIDAVEALQKHVLEIYPHPEVIASDRGQHFCSNLNALFAKINNIHWHHHVSFRPQSCGLLESRHRELKSSIFIMTHTLSVDWPTVLSRVVFIMNAATNKSTRQSPFKALWGVDPIISEFDKSDLPPSGADIPTFLRNRKMVTDLLHDKIKICQEEADEKVRNSRPKIEPEELEPGDEVLLKKELSALAKSTRLKWVGPFTVCKSNGHVVLVADSEGRQDWVHRSQCHKKVDRFPHLGEVPPFPNMKIPLRLTTPTPIENSRPLNPPTPDLICAPEEPAPNTTAGPDDTVFFDCATDLNVSRNSIEAPLTPIPEEPTVPLNPPQNAPWGEIAPLTSIPAQSKSAFSNSQTRRKVSAARQPSSASPSRTRSRARQDSEQNMSDRSLAKRLQAEERRRSTRVNKSYFT